MEGRKAVVGPLERRRNDAGTTGRLSEKPVLIPLLLFSPLPPLTEGGAGVIERAPPLRSELRTDRDDRNPRQDFEPPIVEREIKGELCFLLTKRLTMARSAERVPLNRMFRASVVAGVKCPRGEDICRTQESDS